MSQTASLLNPSPLPGDVSENLGNEHSPERESNEAMRSWQKFLETYLCQQPTADITDSELLETLNARWLHERKQS
jgi:hypothetical protein